MKRFAKLLIVIIAVAALPLRGYAALTAMLCDSHHGTPAASQSMSHAVSHENAHDHEAPIQEHSGNEPLASACSLCSACCVNATAVAEPSQALPFVPQRAARIPFFDAPFQGVFHKLPVPPPLAAAR